MMTVRSRSQKLRISPSIFDEDKNYLGSSYVSNLNQNSETSEDNNVTSTIAVDVPTNIVQTLYDSSEKETKMYVVAVLNKGTFTPQITEANKNYNAFNEACRIALADAAKQIIL